MSKKVLLTLAAITLSISADATEGGGSIYPVGNENFTCCALPPPGLYGMVYAQSLEADKARGNDGQVVTPSTFKVRATAVAPRIVWVSKEQVTGGSFGLHAILPLVDLDVHVAPGVAQRKSGLGDVVFGPFVGWHHSQNLHSVAGLDIFAPTGEYTKGDLANIGRNHWALQAVYGVSWIDPNGLNADAKVMYTFNLKNKDTQYRSGQELIVDYSLGWGFGNGLTAGVGGYLYQQTTDDKQNGAVVADNKGRALSIGPSIKYDSGKGWFVTAKYQVDTHVRNRADAKAFWLKFVTPF
jgi:hypothetical protein